jgi:ubiquitin-protein ligase E3 C
VDGGGLFKDFMESIVREGFNPSRGLFKATAENHLYPNPAASSTVEHGLDYLNFLGKIVGKALYEVGLATARFSLTCLNEARA